MAVALSEKYRAIVRSLNRIEELQAVEAPQAQRFVLGATFAIGSPATQSAFNSYWQSVGADLTANGFRNWLAAQVAEHQARVPVLEAEVADAAVLAAELKAAPAIKAE
jgi:hypothetical protein